MTDRPKAIICLIIAVSFNAMGDIGTQSRVKHLESEVERLTEQVKILKKGGA